MSGGNGVWTPAAALYLQVKVNVAEIIAHAVVLGRALQGNVFSLVFLSRGEDDDDDGQIWQN